MTDIIMICHKMLEHASQWLRRLCWTLTVDNVFTPSTKGTRLQGLVYFVCPCRIYTN